MNDRREGSAFGGSQPMSNEFGKSSFGHTGGDIHSNAQVKNAREVLTIVRGEDGKPQIWSTGKPQQAEQLLRDAAPVLGITELQQA